MGRDPGLARGKGAGGATLSARVELLLRLECAFDVRLPEHLLRVRMARVAAFGVPDPARLPAEGARKPRAEAL